MMNNSFSHLFEISLQTSLMGLFLWALLKSPIKRFLSSKAILLLWTLLLLRFLIPGHINIPQNWIPFLNGDSAQTVELHPLDLAFKIQLPDFQSLIDNDLVAEKSLREESTHTWDYRPLLKQLPNIWILGAYLVCLSYLAQVSLFFRSVRGSNIVTNKRVMAVYSDVCNQIDLHRNIPLIQMDGVGSAAIIGVWNPKIILSPELFEKCNDEQLKTVLLHELTHYQQRHLALNLLGLIVCALHWFNPLVWIFYRELRRSIELACDETAISSKATASPTSYANHLIDLVNLVPIRPPLSLGLLGLLNNLESKFITTRIQMITQSSKSKLPTTLVLSLGLIGVCLCSATIAESETSLTKPSTPTLKQIETPPLLPVPLPPEPVKTATDDFPELNLDVDSFDNEIDFSMAAKKYIKEELLSYFENQEFEKVLPLLINSPYAEEAKMSFLIGNIHLQSSRTKEAELAYIKSFNTNPSEGALKNLSMIYVTNGENEKAKAVLKKYFELSEKNTDFLPSSQLYLMAGVTLMHMDDYPKAEKHFIKALALDSENENARINLFQCYMFLEQYRQAEAQIKQLIAREDDPNTLADYHKYYANVAIGLDDLDLASEQLKLALKNNPDIEGVAEMIEHIEKDEEFGSGYQISLKFEKPQFIPSNQTK